MTDLIDPIAHPTLFDIEPLPDPVVLCCPHCHGTGSIVLEGAIASAPARPTDPATSHAAAEHEQDIRRFSARSRQAALLAVVAATPCTAQQAAIRVVLDTAPVSKIEGCRRRMSDLVRAGLIHDSGQRLTNPGSDEQSIVYCVTEAGLAALTRLEATGWSL